MGFITEEYILSASLHDLFEQYYKAYFVKAIHRDERTVAWTDEDIDSYAFDIMKDFLQDADPTYKVSNNPKMGTYSKWCLAQLPKMEGGFMGGDHSTASFKRSVAAVANVLRQQLQRYVEIQKSLKGPFEKYKSINVFKSLPELEKFINEFYDTHAEELARDGADILYEDDNWLVVSPRTYAASVYFGAGNRWCTADKTSSLHFNQYQRDGNKLVMLLSKREDLGSYQLSWPRYEFRDHDDKSVSDAGKILIDLLPEEAMNAMCTFLGVPVTAILSRFVNGENPYSLLGALSNKRYTEPAVIAGFTNQRLTLSGMVMEFSYTIDVTESGDYYGMVPVSFGRNEVLRLSTASSLLEVCSRLFFNLDDLDVGAFVSSGLDPTGLYLYAIVGKSFHRFLEVLREVGSDHRWSSDSRFSSTAQSELSKVRGVALLVQPGDPDLDLSGLQSIGELFPISSFEPIATFQPLSPGDGSQQATFLVFPSWGPSPANGFDDVADIVMPKLQTLKETGKLS